MPRTGMPRTGPRPTRSPETGAPACRRKGARRSYPRAVRHSRRRRVPTLVLCVQIPAGRPRRGHAVRCKADYHGPAGGFLAADRDENATDRAATGRGYLKPGRCRAKGRGRGDHIRALPATRTADVSRPLCCALRSPPGGFGAGHVVRRKAGHHRPAGRAGAARRNETLFLIHGPGGRGVGAAGRHAYPAGWPMDPAGVGLGGRDGNFAFLSSHRPARGG